MARHIEGDSEDAGHEPNRSFCTLHGASGGYGQGWTDGCLAVFTALGDDTAAAWSDVDGMFDSTFVSTVDRFSCY
jgi:hypothetical protein